MGKKAAGKPKKGKNAVADAVLGDVTDTIQARISFFHIYDVIKTKIRNPAPGPEENSQRRDGRRN